jgi:hypothetical protein
MMKSKRFNCIYIFLGLFLLAAIVFFGVRYGSLRVKANTPPPQILIHKPVNLEEIATDEGTFLHATARSEQGVSRVELWVDGKFIYAQDAPETGPISPLVLHTYWQPTGIGTHEVVVRAYDADQRESTASVLVTALEPRQETLVTYDPSGISESGELPPDSSPPPPPPESGSEHASEASSGPGAPPPADEPPPEPLNTPIQLGVLQLFDFTPDDGGDEAPPSGEGPTLLKLEALGLNTVVDYEGVHCYVGFGGGDPRWYPDTDDNQETDENFSLIGSGVWNIAEYLAEDNGIITYWPDPDPILLDIKCIAYTGGGTEAIDLGRVIFESPMDEWDGVTRQLSGSAEGSFTLNYRITYEEAVYKGLSHDIPPPFNVHIDERRQELHWEWERGEEMERSINGYLIYVNDVLIYRVGYQTQAVWLPYVWFHPPCDVSYRFTVAAYQNPYPDGDYSAPSEPVFLPDPEDEPRTDCNPEFIISFDTLVTGDLGGDDIPNNWANMVRDVTGSFFANDRSTSFGKLDLYPNVTYNINDLTTPTTGDMSHFVYELAEDENLRIGFDLYDFDGGSSQLLCTNALFHDYRYSHLMSYGYFEDTLYSLENDGTRCQVHYTIRPLEGSAFGISNPDYIPLPWLDVVGMSEDPETGELHIQIKNSGSAAWTGHKLWVAFVDRDLDPEAASNSFSEELVLEVGEEKTLTTDLGSRNLANTCIVLDRDNHVLELYESTGALHHSHMKYCLPLPDLRLEEVQFDTEESKLHIKIRNMGQRSSDIGSSAVNLRDVTLRIEPESGRPYIYGPNLHPNIVLERTEAAWLEWDIRPEQRERLLDGYTVVLDPDDDYVETDEDNNSYAMPSGKNIRVAWDGMDLRWYPNWLQDCTNDGAWNSNDVEVWVDVYARTEHSSRHHAGWHWEGWVADEDLHHGGTRNWSPASHVVDFYINGEETLEIEIRGEQDNDSMGSATGIFEPYRNWEIMSSINADRICDERDLRLDKGHPITAYPSGNWSWCGGWDVYVNICEILD